MFASEQYRTKAAEYSELAKTANSPNEARKFQKLEQSFAVLADNEQWLSDNHDQTVHVREGDGPDEATLAEEEEHVLKYLGAALIMQWNTLPTKLQRELFDNAGSMGELLDTPALRGQIARFLHKHKDGEDVSTNSPFVRPDEHAPQKLKTTTENVQSDGSQNATDLARWDEEGGTPKHR